jgi:hypothetical protein
VCRRQAGGGWQATGAIARSKYLADLIFHLAPAYLGPPLPLCRFKSFSAPESSFRKPEREDEGVQQWDKVFGARIILGCRLQKFLAPVANPPKT